MIRLTVIAATAALLLSPLAAQACGAGAHAAKAASTDYAAKAKKHVRKPAKPKEKVEYMRAAPMK